MNRAIPSFDDKYPDDHELKTVKTWAGDFNDLMRFVKDHWKYANCGYWSEQYDVEDPPFTPFNVYRISTAGWSGNESLIDALMDNNVFWLLCWYSSRRGGHYEFRVAKDSPK